MIRPLLWLLLAFGPASVWGDGLGITPPEAFRVPAGFVVDLVYEVPAETEGSWVSLTVDPQGRLVTCDQYGSLFRVTLRDGQAPQVERLEVQIGAAQGLLFAFDSLYVNVNDGRGRNGGIPGGVYRLRDTDGDDQFDRVEHLIELNNAGEHGPHALILTPDGKRIVMCAGNNTDLPAGITTSRVPRRWDEDHLLGRMPDARGHNVGRLAPGGFVASFDPDGKNIDLIATGFRNEYDIAFSPDGELFTYDADMEWDVGTPWYRPTRVNHVISGAEFGWRNGTGKWPAYYPDSFGAAVDIGPGSPTGICFGTGAKFPAKYQQALFIADWSYGHIHAVSLAENGSTYGGSFEPFATAAPLPVTDLVVHPGDGALYFTIGGRRTQSGLYRIRYTGDESTVAVETTGDAQAVKSEAAKNRALRHQLESFHGQSQLTPEARAAAIDLALESLGREDFGIRFAARIALEHQSLELWREQVLRLKDHGGRILGIVALARCGTAADQSAAISSLLEVDWVRLDPQSRLDLLRAYALVFLRLGGKPAPAEQAAIVAQLQTPFAAGGETDPRIRRELAMILVYLGAPGAISRTLDLLEDAPSQEDPMYYAFILRDQQSGWTLPDRERYLRWFQAAAAARGGMSFGGFLENIRTAAIATLGDQERQSLGSLLEAPKPLDPSDSLKPRPVVRQWSLADLEGALASDAHQADYQRGKEMFALAQCAKCHRMGISGGILGPDLTGAGGRFSPKDLLVAILNPNQEVSDQYAATQFMTSSGQVVVGKVINMNGRDLQILTNLLDPSSLTSLKREDIETARPAPNSLMPAGLLDTLSEGEILDLMVFLRSGGDPQHPLYSAGGAGR